MKLLIECLDTQSAIDMFLLFKIKNFNALLAVTTVTVFFVSGTIHGTCLVIPVYMGCGPILESNNAFRVPI